MFDNRDKQLTDLDAAYQAFVQTVNGLSPASFLRSLGDWTPRDIAAHFVGWNRITLVGCGQVREGSEPFYFYDGTNDYRRVNAGFLRRFNSAERAVLLRQMAVGMDALVAYLKTIDKAEWEADTGVVHYRGGPATVARCVDSLIRDYHKHREEIVLAENAA
jgi:hypothetical protein